MKRILFILLLPVFFQSCVSSRIVLPINNTQKIQSDNLSNFYKLNDSVYRSEQPDKSAFLEIQQQGIKSVLNLRNDLSDSISALGLNVDLYRIPVRTSKASIEEVIAALKIIKTAEKPILIHCKHGADRTGAVIAMYRIIFQGISKEQAINEMQYGPYGFHGWFKNLIELIENADIEMIRKSI